MYAPKCARTWCQQAQRAAKCARTWCLAGGGVVSSDGARDCRGDKGGVFKFNKIYYYLLFFTYLLLLLFLIRLVIPCDLILAKYNI